MEYVIQVMIQLRESAVRQYMMHIQPLVLPAAELALAAASFFQWLDYLIVKLYPVLLCHCRIVPKLPFLHPASRYIDMQLMENMKMHVHNQPSF